MSPAVVRRARPTPPYRRATATVAGVATAGAVALQAVRLGDGWRAGRAWRRLARLAATEGARFAPDMACGLPDPARRYFRYAIVPGTPLRTVAVVEMRGSFALGTRERPNHAPMRAREILAPPHGFVWRASIGSGLTRVSGSDGYVDGDAWTSFWLLGAVPVARPAAGPDHARSAAARSVAEALWVPASLLPQNGVLWEAVDGDSARAVFRHRGGELAVTLTVAENGRPIAVAMRRWSDENPERVHRWQPFGASVEAVGSFAGYTVPVRLHAGNHFGTDRYFSSFRVEAASVRYP